jgi:hypothetical protein
VELARGDVGLRRRQVGLLDELDHAARFARRLGPDVAVARLGPRSRHAHHDDRAPGRLRHRGLQGARERWDIADAVIGRTHDQHRVALALRCLECGERQRGRRVAPRRFQQDGIGCASRARELVQHQVAVLLVAHDHRRCQPPAALRQAVQAQQRLLEQRARAAAQREELLGMAGPRQRPQPRAAAARHDHRANRA